MIYRLKSTQRLSCFCTAVVFLFSGCAWIPEGGKRAELIKAPSMEHTLSDAAHGGTSAAQPQWPDQEWWLAFGSHELNSLMKTALNDNPGLKAAVARLHQAQALVRVEGARLLPFLDADMEFVNELISQNGVFAALNRKEAAGANIVFGKINPLNFRYEFDFWGKNRAALQAAIGESNAEEAELAEVKLQLTSAIARSYFHGLALRQQLDLAQQAVQVRHELLLIAETRFQLGLDAEDPAKQAHIELEQVNKREAGVRDQLDMQRNLLARLIGKGPDATVNVFTDKVNTPDDPQLPEKLPLELLAHRPDLASTLCRVEAAAQRIKVAKASFLPTIDLTAFVGFNALRLTKGASSLANILFSGSSFSYGVAPGLRLPWFEGGRLRGELSAQRAEYDESVELYNETLLHAVQEVADSLSSWKESKAILEAQLRLLSAQRTHHNLAEDRYRIGVDDRRLMLSRRQIVLDQEYVLKSLEADHLVARVDVIEALGGGYANDLQLIEQKIKHQNNPQDDFNWFDWVMYLVTVSK